MNWRRWGLGLGMISGLACWLAIAPAVDQHVAWNTFLLGLAVNLVAIPLGITLALTLSDSDRFGRCTLVVCLSLIFLPLFVQVSAWDAAFGKLGWVSGISAATQNSLGPWTMAIWIHSMAAIPQVAIIVWLGLRLREHVQEEHALLDADAFSVFRYITLPKIAPVIGLSVVWNFVVCAREIAVTDIYRIGTFAEQIYLGYSLNDFDAVSSAWTSTSLIALLSLAVFVSVIPAAGPDHFSSDLLNTEHRGSRVSGWIKAVTGLTMLVLLLAPSINLIARASRQVDFIDDQPIVSYSASNLVAVVARVPSTYAEEFRWSAIIAATSTLFLLVVSLLLVHKATTSRVWRLALLATAAISCSLPGPLIGSGLLEFRSLISWPLIQWLFDRTIFAPVVANAIFSFPIAIVLVWFVFLNVPRDADENMALEGANRFSRFYQWTVVANGKILLGAAIIIFAVCFGELSATQLAVPPGIDTIPRRMLGLLHSGVNDHTAGLTIVSVFFVLLLILIGLWLYRWKQLIEIE